MPHAEPYNLIAIGAGAGGLVSTASIAALGGKAALIERRKMGGDCLNYGCVPSKALISSARLAAAIARSQKWGLPAIHMEVKLEEVLKSMREERARIEPNDSVERFTSLGVRVIEGDATLLSPHQVAVNGEIIEGRDIIISAGSRARVPPIEGIEQVPYYTNENFFDGLNPIPKSLIIIGCGPIGCELGQALARLGTQVSMVQRSPRILPKEDSDVAELIAQALREDRVRLLTEHRPEKVSYQNQRIYLKLNHQGQNRTLEADALLIAVGRVPNVENLGLEKAGVKWTARGITTDPYLRTSQKNIYAVGDIAGPYQFTHLADYHARCAVENIIRNAAVPSFVPDSWKLKKVRYRAFPRATFTSPEAAQVGLNEKDAQEAGVAVDIFKVDLRHLDRAILERQATGFAKILTEKGSDKIVGACVVGEHAGDWIHELVLAMEARVPLGKIANTVHAYPTHAEIVRKAADAYKRTQLSDKAAAFLKKLFIKHRRAL